MAISNPQQEALDQSVVNMAKAIRKVESGGNYSVRGGSGEYGAYQYTPGTWNSDVLKFTGKSVPLEQADKLLQNEVAYKKLKTLKDKGYNVAQVAAVWNSGQPDWEGKVGVNKFGVKYDVPGYVNKVAKEYQSLKATSTPQMPEMAQPSVFTPTARQEADTVAKEQSGAVFAPNTESPSAFSESAKLVGNIPTSTWNFVKGSLDLLNPISTYKKIKEAVGAFSELKKLTGGGKQATAAALKDLPGSAYKTLVPEATRGFINAGIGQAQGNQQRVTEGLETAQRSLVTDPVGQIAPFLLAGRGVAGKFNKGAAFDTAISKTAAPVIKPIKAISSFVKGKVEATTKFGIGQATGLQPSTLTEITKTPQSFTKQSQAGVDRISLGREVKSAIDTKMEALKETGKAYDPIRNSSKLISVDRSWLLKAIKEATGLDIKFGVDEANYQNGKMTATPSSKLRENTDIRAVQQLYDLYKPTFEKGKMTPNEFLNFRTDLANLAKFERQIGKSKPVEFATKEIRNKFNSQYRKQLKGLKELDEQFSKEITDLKISSKGIVDKNGELTQIAINRIANATGKGKDILLSRLEETVPGITQKIKVLKAVEDIQNASGIKVGTYGRTGLIAGFGIAGGLLQGIIATILTSPDVAVPLLRQYGLLKNAQVVRAVVQALKSGGEKINKLPESNLLLPISDKEKGVTVFGKK
jgi:hypothetical protein